MTYTVSRWSAKNSKRFVTLPDINRWFVVVFIVCFFHFLLNYLLILQVRQLSDLDVTSETEPALFSDVNKSENTPKTKKGGIDHVLQACCCKILCFQLIVY